MFGVGIGARRLQIGLRATFCRVGYVIVTAVVLDGPDCLWVSDVHCAQGQAARPSALARQAYDRAALRSGRHTLC